MQILKIAHTIGNVGYQSKALFQSHDLVTNNGSSRLGLILNEIQFETGKATRFHFSHYDKGPLIFGYLS